MSLFGQTKRHIPQANKPRRSPLPVFSSDTEFEKYSLTGGTPASSWFTVIHVPLPSFLGRPQATSRRSSLASPHEGSSKHLHHSLSGGPMQTPKQRRYFRLYLPIPPKFARVTPLRILLFAMATLGLVVFMLGFRKTSRGKSWTPPFVDPDTLVLTREEVGRIWEWEILSGHYPSVRKVPDTVLLPSTYPNPAIPPSLLPPPTPPGPLVAYQQRAAPPPKTFLVGLGPERSYVPVESSVTKDTNLGFPPRPVPGSILDLDRVLTKCDLGTGQYVRDCLEYLRIGGNLDNGKRVRRGNYLTGYKQMFNEDYSTRSSNHELVRKHRAQLVLESPAAASRASSLSRAPLSLSAPLTPSDSDYSPASPCDPLHPRLFHMFWAGPFTDKPYMAVMSFLFTQNLGLGLETDEQERMQGICRPQFLVWINPGPAAAVPNPSAKREMLEQLSTNPWSAPFLHPKFKDVVKFKMWNTTEQLDGVPELKQHWRSMPIFNSGGNVYGAPQEKEKAEIKVEPGPPEVARDILADQVAEVGSDVEHDADGNPIVDREAGDEEEATTTAATKKKGGLFDKVGSSSESDYDRLSVILSDMARFVLCHRFGGIYLDADTIFLRDWEELWGWRGQFAYRWSYHQKYNTAVMKLHKNSALGTFLFKTALENGLDFHPMTVSRYLKDAGMEDLLFRVPDALFDPAWLNMERYQRDRPPFPYFPEFSAFFSNDRFEASAPQPLGFDAFFRGAFSYHFHNFWWLPFDPSRNWPDLGSRFSRGEKLLREAQQAAKAAAQDGHDDAAGVLENVGGQGVTEREDMDDEADLSWATVLKRTFEAYLRAERPNMYGEWIAW